MFITIEHIKRFFSFNNTSITENRICTYSEDFKLERLKYNLCVEKRLCIILLVLNTLVFLLNSITTGRGISEDTVIDVLYIRCVIILFHLACLYIIHKILKKNMIRRTIACIIHYIFITGTLVWTIWYVINAQYTHSQISAYIISIFCLTTVIYLEFIERIFFIGVSYLLFLIGIAHVPMDQKQLLGNVINSLFLVVLAFYVSYILHKQYHENYINTKRIQEDSDTIAKLNYDLEKTIRRRTNALMKKHKRLVEETYKRHDTSLELIKAHSRHTIEKLELEKAIEQEKIRTMFLANMSHELRTPLNIIFSAQQMIDRSLDENLDNIKKEKLVKFSRMIKQNSYRLIRLINNLIDITKIDAGHYKIRKRNVDIVKLIEDIYTSFVEYISDKNINVYFHSELTSKVIGCDPDQVERIILNLLANAIKFLPSDGVIKINLYEKEEMVVFTVEDNGIGIPKELQNAIFERFIQVDKTITRNHEGSGIGLSIVKNFVEMHGGKVYVESNLNIGSKFFVELPSHKLMDDVQESLNNIANSRIEQINIEFSDIYFKPKDVV